MSRTPMPARTPHPRRSRRATARALAALAAVLGLLVGTAAIPPAAFASAASDTSVGIEQLTAASQTSGHAFVYRVSYACTVLDGTVCGGDPVIRIPLGPAAGFPVQVGASADIASWSVVGSDLVVHMVDFAEGVSGSIGITITPPNNTTPNGTTWTLDPTLTFGDGITPEADAPVSVTSTATANPTLTVTKTPVSIYYQPGETVRYYVTWDCPGVSRIYGNEDLSSLTLTDTLPAGLTYVSSTPAAGSVSGQAISTTYTGAQLGAHCSQGGATGLQWMIVATVDADVPNDTTLTNHIAATGTPLGAGPTVSSSFDAGILVTTNPPGGGVYKSGYGPLYHPVGDYPTNEPSLDAYTSATYAGAWLGRGIAANPDGTSLYYTTPRDFRIESVYSFTIDMPTSGIQFSAVDPMPCASSPVGAVYAGNAPGDVCTDPAYHPTMITFQARSIDNAANVGIPDAFVPQARLTDGTVVDLDAAPVLPGTEMLASGPAFRTYYVPTADVGRVAELIFPRTDGMTNTRTLAYLGGYVDAARQDGDVIRNVASFDYWRPGATDPYASNESSVSNLYVVDGPQLGLTKTWDAAASAFTLEGDLLVPGPVQGDLTFVDTLPAGIQPTGTATVDVTGVLSGSHGGVPATVTVTADPATGAAVATVRIAAADLNALLVPGRGERFQVDATLPVARPLPGDYTNTATIALDDARVDDTVCAEGQIVGTGSAFSCRTTLDFAIQPDPSSDAVRVSKSVRGSGDADFTTSPAIGHVDPAGGSATYRLTWTNKSAGNVGDVVAYDLLPRVGDTGTLASTAGKPRGSTFRPLLTGLGTLPAGVSVQYSTAANPCRTEVFPDAQNTGCVADWSPTAPADPSTVTALRFSSTVAYAFDTGFSVDILMATPPLSSTADVAWNTFATAQRNLQSGAVIAPTESAKVGLARTDFGHLSISKTVDLAQAQPGDELTYTLSVVNDGGSIIPATTVHDTLPDGVEFVSASGGGTRAGSTVTWNAGDLGVGRTLTYTVVVRVAEAASSIDRTLVNRLTASAPSSPGITAEHPCTDDATASCAQTTVPGADIPAWTLPSAGGSGATSIYVAGGSLVAVAAVAGIVLAVRRRRASRRRARESGSPE